MNGTPFKFAMRNVRQGLSGFRIFLACIALGVTALVGIDSTSRALTDGLATEGRRLLGSDLVISRMHRPASAEDIAQLAPYGQISEIISLRAMARTSRAAALSDLKIIDTGSKRLSDPVLDPPLSLDQLLEPHDGVYGIVADPSLLARLDVKRGDRISFGDVSVELRATLVNEPDRIGAGLTLGPRVIMNEAAFDKSGLRRPDSLIRYAYRLILDDPSDETLRRVEEQATSAITDAGFEIRARNNVSPQLTRNIERFAQYLGLIALTALIIGGLGVANAVMAYIDRRRKTIAIIKALGASGTTIVSMSFIEIMIFAAFGTAIGLFCGALLPFLVAFFGNHFLPFPITPHLYPDRLVLGASYGLLTAAAFAIPVLGRAHDLPVALLFRDEATQAETLLRRRYLFLTLATASALLALILLAAREKLLTAIVLFGVGLIGILLRGIAALIMSWARQARHPRRTELRLALGNIHRRGTITPALTLALGLGVTLLVAISAVQNNLVRLVSSGLPDKAPSFFFVDIAARDLDAFDQFIHRYDASFRVVHVPMLRGRITEVNAMRAETVIAEENARWVLDGDRGITFSEDIPEGSRLVSGTWWPADYSGAPLVSLEAEIAKGLGLEIGDTMTVNVLGRPIKAKIANFRRVDWQSLGINFVLVFSPNTFKGAPVNYLATLTEGAGHLDNGKETDLLLKAAEAFPSVSVIRVREALETLRDLIDQLALAIRGVAGLTILSSIFVLAGAIGASQRRRIRDAVILKTLGATRLRLMTAFLAEFALISFAASLFGLVAGMGAAWAIIGFAFRTAFVWPIGDPLLTALAAVFLAVILGLLGTNRVLDEKPARHLRAS